MAVDFYRHNTVVSNIAVGAAPRYDSTMQFIVAQDVALLRHLDTQSVALDLNRPVGFDFETLARGRLPLRRLAEAVMDGGGTAPMTLYVDLVGAQRKPVGRLRVRVRMARRLAQEVVDDYLSYRQRERQGEGAARHPIVEAVSQASGRRRRQSGLTTALLPVCAFHTTEIRM